jgi:hypothetical protein
MAESETTVPMDDKALFEAATATEAPQVAEAPAPEAAQPEQFAETSPARDEHGRFAVKADPEQAAQTAPAEGARPEATQNDHASIPAWRAGEIAAERRAAVERADAAERRAQDFEHQARQFQAQLRQYTEKPAEEIDPYVDPQKFRDQGVRQAIDPLAKQLADTREYFSRELATTKHGEEVVKEAYKAFETAVRAGDPRIADVANRVFGGHPDPFREIVGWHKRETAMTKIGGDPDKWFDAELERRAASDPAFKQKLQALQSGQQQQAQPAGAQPTNVVQLPPSLTRASGGQSPNPGTMNDADLFRHALS